MLPAAVIGVVRSGLVRVLAMAFAVLGIGWILMRSATVEPSADAGTIVVLDQAIFEPAAGASRAVRLPHTWVRDGLGNEGRGRYRVEFTLPEPAITPWGLATTRLSSRHLVRLNGQLVHGTSPDLPDDRRAVPVPTWIDIAPALLRAGVNTLDIDVALDYRAGTSVLRLGPEPALWPWYLRERTLSVAVPLAINLFGAGLALFMVAIWWRRPSERALGSFAGLMALISIRNVGYAGTGAITHTAAMDALFYLAQVGSAMLLATFALAWSGRDWRGFRRAVNVIGTLLLLAGVAAVPADGVHTLRVFAYPLLIASLLPSLWLIALGALRESGGTRLALVICVVLLCLAPVHDYFHLRGLTPVDDAYWLPLVAPVTLLTFAWALLDRFVAALEAVEGQSSELERRVARRTEELATANAAKTRFLAAASHDLRQPVAAISLLGGMLSEQPLPALARTLVERIGESVKALNSLLQGLLDLSRFDAGVATPRSEAVRLRPLVEAAVADERAQAQLKGLQLRVRVPDATVRADALLLEQILRNLVGNAVRYTDRGGVLVAARRHGHDRLRLQVWDTGCGIPNARQQEVFDEFVQLGNEARERARGLGLGLSLVRRGAELLGAPLRLRSRPGRGSCFEIELQRLGEPVARAAAEPDVASLPLAERLVWVVDDEPDVRAAVELRLRGWGARVQAFAGSLACEAAATAAHAVPDLVITDQRLPGGQGVELAAKLRRHFGSALPVLLVTGDTAPHDLQRLQASGIAVLHKPFDGTALLLALRAIDPEVGAKAAPRSPGTPRAA